MLPSELTNTIEQLCTFIRMKHISPTFMYIIPMYLMLTLQKPCPNDISPIFFAIFISLWGSTHYPADCAGALPDPSCPQQLQTCAPLMHGRVVSPNKNPGYAGELAHDREIRDMILCLYATKSRTSLKLKFRQYSAIHTNYS